MSIIHLERRKQIQVVVTNFTTDFFFIITNEILAPSIKVIDEKFIDECLVVGRP